MVHPKSVILHGNIHLEMAALVRESISLRVCRVLIKRLIKTQARVLLSYQLIRKLSLLSYRGPLTEVCGTYPVRRQKVVHEI